MCIRDRSILSRPIEHHRGFIQVPRAAPAVAPSVSMCKKYPRLRVHPQRPLVRARRIITTRLVLSCEVCVIYCTAADGSASNVEVASTQLSERRQRDIPAGKRVFRGLYCAFHCSAAHMWLTVMAVGQLIWSCEDLISRRLQDRQRGCNDHCDLPIEH